MEKYIADKISNWCLKRNKVSEIQEVAIRYGIELYLDSTIKIFLIIFIGTLLGRGYETIIAIACFCMLRSQAGGIHMKSSFGCFSSMIIIVLLSVVGAEFIQKISVPVIVILSIVSVIAIYLFAPYTTANNPINDEKIILSKKRKAMLIVALVGLIACVVESSRVRALLLIPVIIEIITILPFWRRKEERINDKRKLSE